MSLVSGIRSFVRRARLGVLLAGAGVFIGACGGGEDDAAAAGGSGNTAPTISGLPPTTVMQGQIYNFTPTATDADGNPLTFSITNLPPWATFTASSGQLTGAPTAADVGTYTNIRISVSDGTTTTSLGTFSVQVVATTAGSVTLNWTVPSQNTDGTPLTNIKGYKIYWGTSSGTYPNSVTLNNPGLTTYVVDQLTAGTWYFSATVMNTANNESALSNAVSRTVQ